MTPFEEVCAVTKKLHDGLRGPQGDEELDGYRETIARAWRDLTELECRRARGLSADLYSLSGMEDFEPELHGLSQGAATLQLFEALDRLDQDPSAADRALYLLRTANLQFRVGVDLRAYLRARCWQQLGYATIAEWFLDLAYHYSTEKELEEALRRLASFRKVAQVLPPTEKG